MDIHVYYRLASRPAAGEKEKLLGADKEACLKNCIAVFGRDNLCVYGDRLDEDTKNVVHRSEARLIETDEGSGGGNFRAAAQNAMRLPEETFIYLVEDDFLHRPEAPQILIDGIELGAEYVTLYDHPDKYLAPTQGGNPLVRKGGEKTTLLCGKRCHWKITNSTVMTFATTAGQLRKDWKTFLRYCGGRYTDDYKLFRELGWRGRKLLSSVPGFATHCESKWLSPLFNWSSLLCKNDRDNQVPANQ